MKYLIFGAIFWFSFVTWANQAMVNELPSPTNTTGGCNIFLDKDMKVAGPSYEQMMHLMQFKPSTRLLVSSYLQLENGQSPLSVIPKMAYYSPLKYQGTPTPGRHSMDCSIARPLAAELNMMFGTRFEPNPLPPLLDPALLPGNGTDDHSSIELPVYNDQCWDAQDVKACQDHFSIELPVYSDECWDAQDVQACQDRIHRQGIQVVE